MGKALRINWLRLFLQDAAAREPPPVPRRNRRFTKFPPSPPQLPANPRICRRAGASGAVVSSRCLSGGGFSPPGRPAFARISPRKFTEIYRKTPSICRYLSIFFGNSVSAGEAVGSAIIPESPRVRADGKCGQTRPPGDAPGKVKSTRSQMRGNARERPAGLRLRSTRRNRPGRRCAAFITPSTDGPGRRNGQIRASRVVEKGPFPGVGKTLSRLEKQPPAPLAKG